MTREDDINTLINAVINIPSVIHYRPNHADESTCPFCHKTKYFAGNQNEPDMSEIEHDVNCAYLIAKDLNTNK